MHRQNKSKEKKERGKDERMEKNNKPKRKSEHQVGKYCNTNHT